MCRLCTILCHHTKIAVALIGDLCVAGNTCACFSCKCENTLKSKEISDIVQSLLVPDCITTRCNVMCLTIPLLFPSFWVKTSLDMSVDNSHKILNLIWSLTLCPLGNFSCFLAHLSRRLMGELIVYQSLRRPSVRPSSVRQHFQTSSPLKPLGQLKSNFIWRLLRTRERKCVQMVLVT